MLGSRPKKILTWSLGQVRTKTRFDKCTITTTLATVRYINDKNNIGTCTDGQTHQGTDKDKVPWEERQGSFGDISKTFRSHKHFLTEVLTGHSKVPLDGALDGTFNGRLLMVLLKALLTTLLKAPLTALLKALLTALLQGDRDSATRQLSLPTKSHIYSS